MRPTSFPRLFTLLSVLMLAPAVQSGELTGRVIAVDDGRGLAQAAVTLTVPDGAAGPDAITVFTAADGSFRLPVPALSLYQDRDARLEARKLGYVQVDAAVDSAGAEGAGVGGVSGRTLFLERVADIAAQVPASAWLSETPAGPAKQITLTSCTSCHQLPSPRVREYADQIEAASSGPGRDRMALEAWRKVIRHESWRMIIRYMRSKHYSVFPLESPMSLDAVDWPTAQNADYNFFNERQGEIVAQFLTDHFPRSTGSMPRDSYSHGASLGVTDRTIIREYSFPKEALVRELVPAPGSSDLWGADVKRNLIVRLNPESGEARWYPVDFAGSTGPHTIVPDASGIIWVSMIDHDQFGRFEPASGKWKLWRLRPSNLPDSASMGGAAFVHDMAIDSRGHLARDTSGRIWLTLAGSNQLGTLDPATGEVAFHDVNHIEGLSPINHLIYSAVLSADGKHAWYSQLNGAVGCMSTASMKVEKIVSFPEGAGPRRMARDDAGNLWVALFGSGQVARIDMATGQLLATFDLPDRSAAPYAVTWDQRREAVWVANANSDAIYRLDPGTGEFAVYPLPRPMAYLRQLAVDQATGRLVGSYGNYPEGSGPSMGVMIDVGD